MIRPLGNKVVVERIEAQKQSAGGIILHRTDGPDKAKIIAVGPQAEGVSVGEIALINWNAAAKAEGETYVVPVDDIVFIYEE